MCADSRIKALMEILVEELSNHLYLKTAYSESRWMVYQPGQTDSESFRASRSQIPTIAPSDRPDVQRRRHARPSSGPCDTAQPAG